MTRAFHPFTPSTGVLELGPLIADPGGVILAELDLDDATGVLVVGFEANATSPLFLAKIAANDLRQLTMEMQ